ncbi:MAG: hypothetical protein ACE5I1_32990, partial [bacterium]
MTPEILEKEILYIEKFPAERGQTASFFKHVVTENTRRKKIKNFLLNYSFSVSLCELCGSAVKMALNTWR